MATLRDVAKLANVDVSTVSRALNNQSYVHPETKERILKAVQELSYHPNVLARSLRQGKRHIIAIVVPSIQLALFAELIIGVEREARRAGYETLICNSDDDAYTEREILVKLQGGVVDGVLIAATGKNGRILRNMQAEGISVVQIVREQEENIDSVVGDYEACGYEATKYLFKKGCRKIGFVKGNMELAPYQKRYAGYQKALSELSLEEISAEENEKVNTFDYGYKCTDDLLEKEPNLDAIVVPVDVQALGAMRVLKERNIHVPNQLKLISLTGHSVGGMLETTITAFEMPAIEIGQRSARAVISKIETSPKDNRKTSSHIVFNSVLTEREST